MDVTEQYLNIQDVDPATENKDGEKALELSAEHRDCALAIARRMEELESQVPSHPEMPENPMSKRRRKATAFVASLVKDHKNGMYNDGYL